MPYERTLCYGVPVPVLLVGQFRAALAAALTVAGVDPTTTKISVRVTHADGTEEKRYDVPFDELGTIST